MHKYTVSANNLRRFKFVSEKKISEKVQKRQLETTADVDHIV